MREKEEMAATDPMIREENSLPRALCNDDLLLSATQKIRNITDIKFARNIFDIAYEKFWKGIQMNREKMRIGIAQISSGKDKRRNLEKLEKAVEGSSADIIVTPEYFMYNPYGDPREKVYEEAEDLDGSFANAMKELSSRLGASILATLFTKNPSSRKIYNEALLFSPSGEISLRYRKAHLFDAYGYRESDFMDRGNEPSAIVEVKGSRIAAAICYDLRFPELFRTYALMGAELVLVPSGWYRGDMKEEILHILGRSRAHENTIFLVIADQYSDLFVGRSAVIGPMGEIISDLGSGEKYREVEIDLSEIQEAREKVPVLKQRNPNVYKL